MNAPAFSFVAPQNAERPYSVTEINHGVSSIIEAGNTLVWIEGEVSNFKPASSGHCYLKLKDAQSQIPAVIWKNVASLLMFELQDGMQVVAIGSLRVYERGGYYQLDLHKIQESGVGALFAAFEKLKKKLQAQGLFDESRKKPIPSRVDRLGVITSKNGAALKDIIKVTWSRSRRVDIVFIDVAVQGDKAAPAIARAIDDMNAFGKIDCIIVGRGGGAVEDLWAFNDEGVAMAIAKSKIPIISAVGHEIDFTIADFVADMRAPTPSAAAEMAIADDEESRRYFIARAQYIVRRFISYFSTTRSSYRQLLKRPGLRRVERMTIEARQTTDEIRSRSRRAMAMTLRHCTERFKHAGSKLNALSPLNTMARGFSVVAKTDGATVNSAAQVVEGERVAIHFFKGNALADIVTRQFTSKNL